MILAPFQLYQNISNEIDKNTSDTGGENRVFEWTYGGGWFSDSQSDICQYNEIDYEQECGTVSTFFTQSTIYEGQVQPAVNWKVKVEAPTSCSTSVNRNNSSSAKDIDFPSHVKERFGLRKVPIRKLRARGIKLKDPLIVDGDKAWFATKPQGRIDLVADEDVPF